MKKLLLLLGVATTLAANAATPTLTQDWAVTTGLPDQANARWVVGKSGKVYIHDKSTKNVLCFDENGSTVYATGQGGSGTALAMDDAGNIMISNGMWGTGATTWRIIPADTKVGQDLTITLPTDMGVASGQHYTGGHIAGNIMSAEGGAYFLTCPSAKGVAKIVIANGTQDASKSKFFDFGTTSDGTQLTGENLGHFQALGADATSDEFLGKAKRANQIQRWDVTSSKWTYFPKAEGQNSTAGGDFVSRGDGFIGVVPSGTNYKDGFVVTNEKGEVLATHAENASFTANTKGGYGNPLDIEQIDENTYYIYHFLPGSMVAKYTLTFPDETPAKMFVIGETSGKVWDPTQGVELTKTAPGVYTGSVTFDKVGCYIAFSEDLAANNDQGGWDYVNGIRYSTNDGAAYRTMASALPVSKQNASFRVDRKGTFTVTLDLNAGTVKFEGEAYTPAALRIVGAVSTIKTLDPWELEAHDWDTESNLLVATKSADAATYDFTGIVFNNEANQEFCFADGTATAWDTSDGTPSVNAFRYGHETIDGEKVLLGSKGDTKELQGTQICFRALHGAQYAFHVDLDALTVTAEGYSGIQNNLIKAANVAVGQGAIYVLEGNNTSIYNTMGQTVVANSTAKTFNVPAGLYIVNVDGKTTKVLVR